MSNTKTLDDIVNSIVSPSTTTISVAALQDAISKRAEQRKEAVADVLVQVFERGEKNLQAQVNYLRELRKKEKLCKEKVDETAAAIKFLGETGNPFPLLKLDSTLTYQVCQILGMTVPEATDPIWNVK